MPSKVPPILFRLPWLRNKFGGQANSVAKAVLSHPQIKEAIDYERCPICGKSFDECEYFRSLDDD